MLQIKVNFELDPVGTARQKEKTSNLLEKLKNKKIEKNSEKKSATTIGKKDNYFHV